MHRHAAFDLQHDDWNSARCPHNWLLCKNQNIQHFLAVFGLFIAESHSVNSCFCFFSTSTWPCDASTSLEVWHLNQCTVQCVQVDTCEESPLPLLCLASSPVEREGGSLENRMCPLRVLIQGHITCDSGCKNHCTVPTLPLPTKLSKHKVLLRDRNTGRRHEDLTQKCCKKKLYSWDRNNNWMAI